MRKYVLVMLCLVCFSLAWAQEMPTITAQDIPADIAAQIPTVTISAQPYYVYGDAIPVTMQITAQKSAYTIYLNMERLAASLPLVITDSTGRKLQKTKRWYDDIRFGIGIDYPEDSYIMRQGETVSFTYDLAQLYQFPQTGQYHFSVNWNYTNKRLAIATQDIRLIATTKLADVTSADIPSAKESSYTAATETANIDGADVGFLHVTFPFREGGSDKPELRHAYLPIRAQTRVTRAALDYQHTLWFLLDTGTERSLVVFDAARQQFFTLISWGQAQIEFGTARSITLRELIVIAGAAGKTHFTTTSLPWLLQQPQTVQLPE